MHAALCAHCKRSRRTWRTCSGGWQRLAAGRPFGWQQHSVGPANAEQAASSSRLEQPGREGVACSAVRWCPHIAVCMHPPPACCTPVRLRPYQQRQAAALVGPSRVTCVRARQRQLAPLYFSPSIPPSPLLLCPSGCAPTSTSSIPPALPLSVQYLPPPHAAALLIEHAAALSAPDANTDNTAVLCADAGWPPDSGVVKVCNAGGMGMQACKQLQLGRHAGLRGRHAGSAMPAWVFGL